MGVVAPVTEYGARNAGMQRLCDAYGVVAKARITASSRKPYCPSVFGKCRIHCPTGSTSLFKGTTVKGM
jgi:hypothetical protein